LNFTLTYTGDLPPNANAKIKWQIRRQLEPQLRKLWKHPALLDKTKYIDPSYQPNNLYLGLKKFGFEFIPIISTKLELRADLQVQLLSDTLPGDIIRQGGDIDNRLKTLFDALSVPINKQQIPNEADMDFP
jgi:hypothetical protein